MPPDDILADGGLHRFASSGKRGDDAAWYVLHDDGIPAGAFGCWRAGVTQTWRANPGRKLSVIAAAALQRRMAELARKREADEAQRHDEARERAAQLWDAAAPADPAHAYLARKNVRPHGIRQSNGKLLVPMRDADGVLWNVERIEATPGAKKKGLFGGGRTGLYCAVRKPEGVLCIAEC